jgi:hypothetical protein
MRRTLPYYRRNKSAHPDTPHAPSRNVADCHTSVINRSTRDSQAAHEAGVCLAARACAHLCALRINCARLSRALLRICAASSGIVEVLLRHVADNRSEGLAHATTMKKLAHVVPTSATLVASAIFVRSESRMDIL